MKRIWVDFMKTDDQGRILLTSRGTLNDLKAQHISLREGLELSVYSDDTGDDGKPDNLLAEGIVYHARNQWVLDLGARGVYHESEAGRNSSR